MKSWGLGKAHEAHEAESRRKNWITEEELRTQGHDQGEGQMQEVGRYPTARSKVVAIVRKTLKYGF